ncbi:MAG: hypothetical protein R3B13_33725 [Polyangiaceae bacterium]
MSKCQFPIFDFGFSIPLAIPSIPFPDLTFPFTLDLFCPLD